MSQIPKLEPEIVTPMNEAFENTTLKRDLKEFGVEVGQLFYNCGRHLEKLELSVKLDFVGRDRNDPDIEVNSVTSFKPFITLQDTSSIVPEKKEIEDSNTPYIFLTGLIVGMLAVTLIWLFAR